MTKPCKFCAQGIQREDDGTHWIVAGILRQSIKIVKCSDGKVAFHDDRDAAKAAEEAGYERGLADGGAPAPLPHVETGGERDDRRLLDWHLERVDEEDGSISYEIWDRDPKHYRRVVKLNDGETGDPSAKLDAETIVKLALRAPVEAAPAGVTRDNPLLPNKVLDDNYARAIAADGASGNMSVDSSFLMALIDEVRRSRLSAIEAQP